MKNVIEGYNRHNRCVLLCVRPSACVLLVFVFKILRLFFFTFYYYTFLFYKDWITDVFQKLQICGTKRTPLFIGVFLLWWHRCVCEMGDQINCRGTTQTNRNNHVVSSGVWGNSPELRCILPVLVLTWWFTAENDLLWLWDSLECTALKLLQ